MDDGSRQAKSTGYTPPIKAAKGSASAPVESTDKKKASPVSKIAPMKGESSNFAVEVSASNILAVQMVMGDFKALKAQLPKSWQASSNGKIYWCAEMTGHQLAIVNGALHIDGQPVENILAELLK